MSFWSDGLKFECQGSGKCCTSRGSYGYVYLTLKDRRRMANFFGLRTTDFTKEYCDSEEGHFFLKDSNQHQCRFLEGKKCSIYGARPDQCRTWPFWSENLKSAKVWNRDVVSFCPGIGKGKTYSEKEIAAIVDLDEEV